MPFFNSILLGSRASVSIPVFGSFMKWNGIYGSDPDNLKRLMNKKYNISFLPGGFEEATMTDPNEYRLWINDRKGFIRYALEYGYKVYPVFVFKEVSGYKTSDLFMK